MEDVAYQLPEMEDDAAPENGRCPGIYPGDGRYLPFPGVYHGNGRCLNSWK